MRKCIKKMALLITMVSLTAANTGTALAGQWKSDRTGWWYQNDDGSYPTNCWQWIDGDNNGIAECYYFNGSGYMYWNTMTPDGYQVDGNGAWLVNGVVQTQVLKG